MLVSIGSLVLSSVHFPRKHEKIIWVGLIIHCHLSFLIQIYERISTLRSPIHPGDFDEDSFIHFLYWTPHLKSEAW